MKDIKRLREILTRLQELGLPEETLKGLADWVNNAEREQTLVQGLADIASNFGGGSASSSPGFDTEQRFRLAASQTLQAAGYVYKEYPRVPPDSDGWYLEI